MAKTKKFTGAVMNKIEDKLIVCRELNDATGVPVSLSEDDWDFLRVRGQFKMRIPHDDTAAFFGDVPVKRVVA